MKKTIAAGLLTLLMAGSVWAGPVTDFENELRAAYADYRSALFMTNAGKEAESEKAIGTLIGKWQGLVAAWGKAPPPHYADDSAWQATLDDVSKLAAAAETEIKSGKLAEAHETLEGVRDAIGALHIRNNFISFSDRMNAYHAAMEELLEKGLSDGLPAAHERTAVLEYLARDALAHPPAEASESADFEALGKAMTISVNDLLAALRANDETQAKAALVKIKPAYAKLFLKFG